MTERPTWSRPLNHLWQRWLPRRWRRPVEVPIPMWNTLLDKHVFFSDLNPSDQLRLRLLTAHFLAEKEFFGANGLVITDPMVLSIAAQACLPLLHMARPDGTLPTRPPQLLEWYGDFVVVVVQPGASIARRETTDALGVVHRYQEVLAGEAMHGGPVMLSWDDVSRAAQSAASGHNVVIHEFAHKIDMHGRSADAGHADGAPPLPRNFLGLPGPRQAQEHWRSTMQAAYDDFRDSVNMAERFGGEKPWLDDYAAQSPAEFFAVTSEAYFVSPSAFAQAFPDLLRLYDGFYGCARPTHISA